MDLVILAAGKGSRMNSSLPKALHKVNKENNINNTYNKTKDLFDNVHLIVDTSNESIFADNVNRNIKIQGISSGLGSGHALMEALKVINISKEFVLIWGDAYISDSTIIEELINYNYNFVIPVSKVNNPYVSFKVDDKLNCTSVDFSKYGEINNTGLQDKCIFKMDSEIALRELEIFHNCTFKDGRYITESNEFEFLYLIHSSKKFKCYITDEDSIFSFNTIDELKEIQNKLER